jgi:hypothetical protein
MRDKDVKKRDREILAELSAEWDRRLGAVKGPKFRERVEEIMKANGRAKRRGKAGPTY